MVTDQQVRRLKTLMKNGDGLPVAAAKSGMCEKTASKWIDSNRLPSQVKVEHSWATRKDPFEEHWQEIVDDYLSKNAGLEAKTIFQDLQRKYPGKYCDGQLRTLQRRIKRWRALEGPAREVFFAQKHFPGILCASDFTHMDKLDITICRQSFPHLIYHFMLTYSNWETGTICFSENYESLSTGFQNAIWELGGVPERHRTDRLSTAVHNDVQTGEFTEQYGNLLKHYRIRGECTQAGKPNENGSIEQRHNRFKNAVKQALMLRGSNDFKSREEYDRFLRRLFKQLNSGRQNRFREELQLLKSLPEKRLDDFKVVDARVGQGSTIRVLKNVYSVNSRLIGELVRVRVYMDHIEVWYAQRLVEKMPRIIGRKGYKVQYRHVIDWLVRKPGAFENYRYKSDLFPSTNFRIAYDILKSRNRKSGHKEYLKILKLAARVSEQGVEEALRHLIETDDQISVEKVEGLMNAKNRIQDIRSVYVVQPSLAEYDALLN